MDLSSFNFISFSKTYLTRMVLFVVLIKVHCRLFTRQSDVIVVKFRNSIIKTDINISNVRHFCKTLYESLLPFWLLKEHYTSEHLFTTSFLIWSFFSVLSRASCVSRSFRITLRDPHVAHPL